jgi:hypothetical protein
MRSRHFGRIVRHRPFPHMSTFSDALTIRFDANATRVAGDLFRAAYGSELPTPRDIRIGDHTAQAKDWSQVVATYRFPNQAQQCVGFMNFIRVEDFFLMGGVCADTRAYRRMTRAEFEECQRRGGFAQCMAEWSEQHLQGGIAIVGYTGDKRSLAAAMRCGYSTTTHPYLIVRPIGAPSERDIARILARAEQLGPF